MAITTIYTYPLDGTKREFSIPFEYLARRFVVLTLIGKDRKELTLTTDFRFTSKSLVQTNVAWGPGAGYERIEIRRNTSATDRLVDFADGSILRASELNISQIQTLHVAEEARNMVADTISENADGALDARGRKIANVGDAVNPGDAITLRQVKSWNDSALNQAAASAASAAESLASANKSANSATAAAAYRDTTLSYRNAAETFKNAAETSNQNAFAWETLASKWASHPEDTLVADSRYSSLHYSRKSAASATVATGAASTATSQAGIASTQADRAKTEADRAKTEADKLAGHNGLAANVDTTSTSPFKVAFKGIVRAAKYIGGVAYGSQLATEAPFVSTEDSLDSTSSYRPLVKQIGMNTGTGTASFVWSLGTLTQTDGSRRAVMHVFNGTNSGTLTVDSSGAVSANGSMSAPAMYDNNGRVWTNLTFNPNTKLAGADNGQMGSCGRYNVTYALRYDTQTAAAQVYNGAIEIREAGLVANGGPSPNHAFNAPGITFHWAAVNVAKLWMQPSAAIAWGNPNGQFCQLNSAGNISGASFGDMWLTDWLATYYLQRGNLGSQMVASLTVGALGSYAFLNNQSGAVIGPGGTLASGLVYTSNTSAGGGAAGGTWRCCGYGNNGSSLWQRIA